MSLKPLVSLIVLGLFFSSGIVLGAQNSGSTGIKKCQDATGRWHYGDTAAAACAKSKVTVINEGGMTKEVIAAPPTAEELKRREAQRENIEAEQTRMQEQKRKDALLLSTYGVEDDIIYVRDRKIAQIESQIKASEETLKSLRAALARMEAQAPDESKDPKAAEATAKNIDLTRAQIARHEAAVAGKRQEQEALRKQYAYELERYRELKKKPATTTPVKADQ